ncbi:MAG: hypothetical protein JSV52_00610 [Candidatus Zixiibacteriota bacterium]|nr:MAG: hypothetical protein JSV52_00610 [candidate division Zixibacteria bacterium]
MRAQTGLLPFLALLIIAVVTESRSQVPADTTSEDDAVEYVITVSPDLKYAVLRTTSWDARGVLVHERPKVRRHRLVRVLDIRQGLFETIRELPTEYNDVKFCDTVTILVTVYSKSGYDQHLQKLMLYRLLESDSMTVLYERGVSDSSLTTFSEESGAGFTFKDSTLAYFIIVEDTASEGPGIDFSVIIRRFAPDGSFPIVREIPHAAMPNFSQDGSQVLYTYMDLTDSSHNLGVYSIAGDSIARYPQVKPALSAQRLTANSPIYYLSLSAGADIRHLDPLTGTDTSLTNVVVGGSHVHWFALTGDSIAYEIETWDKEQSEHHLRTLKLKPVFNPSPPPDKGD